MVQSVEQSTLINDAIPVKYETCSSQPQSVELYSITVLVSLLQFRELNWFFKWWQNVGVNCLCHAYLLIYKLKWFQMWH